MRTMTLAALGAFAAAAAMTGCAPTEGLETSTSDTARECFYARQATGFSDGEGDSIHVRAGRSVYQLETAGYCPNINWSHRIGIVPRGGGDRICAGFDADLVVNDPAGGVQRCAVRSVRKLSDGEVDALD